MKLYLSPFFLRILKGIVLMVLTLSSQGPLLYAQYDANGDGALDLVLTSVEPDGRLRWLVQDIDSGQYDDLGVFGHRDYQVNLGPWSLPRGSSRTYVMKEELGDFELINEQFVVTSCVFGKFLPILLATP